MTTLGPKGQVVIPKPIRDAPGLRPGDSVACRPDGRRVVIEAAADLVALRGASAGEDLLADPGRERAAERRRDP